MAGKIRVILKEVDKPGVVTEIDDDIETLQELAGGPDRLIGMCSFPIGENIDIIYADNYLNDGSKANFLMPEMKHIMGGTCIIAGYDPEDGGTISLTDEQIEIASEYLEKNHVQKMDMRMAYYTMLTKENVM
ncbi:MAG: DUF3846 domain-containing protein [Bacilli bacterium]